jgi:hypothetical protein
MECLRVSLHIAGHHTHSSRVGSSPQYHSAALLELAAAAATGARQLQQQLSLTRQQGIANSDAVARELVAYAGNNDIRAALAEQQQQQQQQAQDAAAAGHSGVSAHDPAQQLLQQQLNQQQASQQQVVGQLLQPQVGQLLQQG